MAGIVAHQNIPQAHKIALQDIPKAWNPPLWCRFGYAIDAITKAIGLMNICWTSPIPPDVDEMVFATDIRTDFPERHLPTWEGYVNPNGGPAEPENI